MSEVLQLPPSNLVINKPDLNNQTRNNNLNKYLINGFIVFIVLIVLYMCSCMCGNKHEEFNNSNMLEQQMYQEMTEENKQIYLELTDTGKQNMFVSWKKIKNL